MLYISVITCTKSCLIMHVPRPQKTKPCACMHSLAYLLLPGESFAFVFWLKEFTLSCRWNYPNQIFWSMIIHVSEVLILHQSDLSLVTVLLQACNRIVVTYIHTYRTNSFNCVWLHNFHIFIDHSPFIYLMIHHLFILTSLNSTFEVIFHLHRYRKKIAWVNQSFENYFSM